MFLNWIYHSILHTPLKFQVYSTKISSVLSTYRGIFLHILWDHDICANDNHVRGVMSVKEHRYFADSFCSQNTINFDATLIYIYHRYPSINLDAWKIIRLTQYYNTISRYCSNSVHELLLIKVTIYQPRMFRKNATFKEAKINHFSC